MATLAAGGVVQAQRGDGGEGARDSALLPSEEEEDKT
jgi:hypothetical protein